MGRVGDGWAGEDVIWVEMKMNKRDEWRGGATGTQQVLHAGGVG